MTLLGLIILVSFGTLSSPMPLNSALSTENSSDQLPSAPDNFPDPRSPYSIVFTCLITTFLCAWTSVHPNIPPTDISWWSRKKFRIELLFLTIVAPELILSWALSQWMGAKKLSWEHKAEGWTMAHGFLLMMGGFCYVREDGTRPILNYDHARDDNGEILTSDIDHIVFKDMESSQIQQITNMVSEKEIQDKSKSDFLSKSITAVQTTWFMVQCIARRVQGLPITELELTTIAIAMLNILMMFFWWHKPMDVEVPILLHGNWNSSQLGADEGRLDNESLGREEQIHESSESEASGYPVLEWLCVTGPLASAIQIISQDRDGIPRSDTRFTIINLSSDETEAISVFFVIIATVFGGLHLVAWTFTFPSRGAWVCWQTAALVITAGPYAMVILGTILLPLALLLLVVGSCGPLLGRIMDYATLFIIFLFPFSYIAARLTLLIEALVLLAYIPPDGLKQIDWLRFIPHL